MGFMEDLLNDGCYEEALTVLDGIIERVCGLVNFDQWKVDGVSAMDVLFALFNLEDDIIAVKEEEEGDCDECCDECGDEDEYEDDEDFDDGEIEICECVECDPENCPHNDKSVNCGGWAC